jgi:hypothetical protein
MAVGFSTFKLGGDTMGADLYRTGYERIVEAHKMEFDAALAARKAAWDTYPNGRPDCGDDIWCSNDPHQQEIDRIYGEMYPPSHYFRDSYNDSGLTQYLDFSWWGTPSEYYEPCTEGELEEYGEDKCYSSRVGPEELLRMVADLKAQSELLAYNLRDLPDEHETKFDKRYFLQKYDRLIAFLSGAAEAGDSVMFSV